MTIVSDFRLCQAFSHIQQLQETAIFAKFKHIDKNMVTFKEVHLHDDTWVV